MIYITLALKSEAQGVIDKYKLKKEIRNNYKIFFNKDILITVSGIGVENSKLATNFLLNSFNIFTDDIILNIGICGANQKFNIGELVEIGSIMYKDNLVRLNTHDQVITCLDSECSDNKYELVDMESFGFYEATKEKNNVRMFKIVSDHFEPKNVTKEKTKMLIFNKIEKIIQEVL